MVQVIPQSDEYREGWERVWGEHLEVTVWVDMDVWSPSYDSLAAPVSPMGVSFEGVRST